MTKKEFKKLLKKAQEISFGQDIHKHLARAEKSGDFIDETAALALIRWQCLRFDGLLDLNEANEIFHAFFKNMQLV